MYRNCQRVGDAIKTEMARVYPDKKPGAIPVDTDTIYKFLQVVQDGDYVIYPSKSYRMVNIGQFDGPYRHAYGDADEHPNQRPIKWLDHFPRSDFSQSALHEIGSFLTMFQVKRHLGEVLAKIGADGAGAFGTAETPSEDREEDTDDDAATVTVSRPERTLFRISSKSFGCDIRPHSEAGNCV